MDYPLLSAIDSPADLRRLPRTELQRVADELRAYVLDSVSKTGGHLGSNLGTVELTVALHYVFNTPEDRLVWDVGHQTYPHKVLTGRRDRMSSLRQLGGISGFPRRDESVYDTFGTGHSSTSISAAHGMAIAAKLKGEDRKAVDIIGDGSMTAGMAFEALNNAGVAHGGLLGDVLVILNDNDMSISPPVGALNKYLARLMSGSFYAAAREGAKSVLKHTPLYEFARKFEEHTKGMVVPGTIFEEFGFNYVGPIDGHDLDALIPTLENLRDKKGPQFLHIVTKKGAGYKLAEADPVKYHAAAGKFDPAVGFVKPATPPKTTFTQVFGEWLCDMAEADTRLVGITPAMREGSGMVEFHKRFPQRYHDVGIAEQHSVTFAAGLVGADGATHAGNYDIAFTRCIPNMAVLTPADEDECRQALYTGFLHDGPATVRYPRGAGAGVTPAKAMTALAWGKGEIRRESASKGQRIAVLAFGTLLYAALEAAERLDATVANMRFVKPLDVELVAELARTHDALVTVEDGCVMGGAGSAVTEALNAAGLSLPVLQLGLPDEFVEHGDPAKLMSLCGLDAAGIEASIVKRFGAKPQVVRATAAR